jgi:Natural resistance-associated macrophage protein
MVKRIPSFLHHVGPGVVTGAADDDPSGIATCTQAGAQFGTSMVWTVFLSLPCMIAIQLVSAGIGRVTGKGVVANLRDHTPRWFLLCMVLLLVIACITDVSRPRRPWWRPLTGPKAWSGNGSRPSAFTPSSRWPRWWAPRWIYRCLSNSIMQQSKSRSPAMSGGPRFPKSQT